MTRGRSRQERIQACAAITDPHQRQCWHLRRINQLLNKLAQRVREVNTLDAKLRVAQEKIAAQKITLARMNVQAEAHNKEIVRLQRNEQHSLVKALRKALPEASVEVLDHTPTPQFVSNNDMVLRVAAEVGNGTGFLEASICDAHTNGSHFMITEINRRCADIRTMDIVLREVPAVVYK